MMRAWLKSALAGCAPKESELKRMTNKKETGLREVICTPSRGATHNVRRVKQRAGCVEDALNHRLARGGWRQGQPRLSGNETTNFGNLGRNTFPRSAPTELIDRLLKFAWFQMLKKSVVKRSDCLSVSFPCVTPFSSRTYRHRGKGVCHRGRPFFSWQTKPPIWVTPRFAAK